MCRLKIQYAPVHGAKAIYRSAVPLATDTARAMDKVKENVVKESSRENLNTNKESLQGEHTKHHQTAPHLSARLGQLQSELARPTISTIKAHKSHQQVDSRGFQTRHLSAKINQFDVNDPREVCVVGWPGAALANRIDTGSTGGYVIAAANPAAMQGKPSPVTLVSWRSGRPARKARSLLAAELLSETDQELMVIRLAWAELCGDLISLSESTGKIAAVRGTIEVLQS